MAIAIVFLHGHPTSSYLWRNIVAYLSSLGRCLAPDLVGMGQSGNSPTQAYRFVDHARYLDAWLEAGGLRSNVTLVVHDWGSAPGFLANVRPPRRGEGQRLHGGRPPTPPLGRIPARPRHHVSGDALRAG